MNAAHIRIELLGPLHVRVAGTPIVVPGQQRRLLLAVLALSQNRPVGVDRLVDCLWPDDPPANASQALYNHISRLRRDLGPAAARLERRASSYVLRLEPGELDVIEARELAREAAALLPTDPDAAGRAAAQASAMWRGAALEEWQDAHDLRAEAVGLAELRQAVDEDLLEARIRTGDPTVTADVAAAAAGAPLSERICRLHMLALARDGRSAEAMSTAAAYRDRLAEETGLDPSPALARLEHDVAAGTPDEVRTVASSSLSGRRITAPTGPFVGREHDLGELDRLSQLHRVVTLTGPGGVGKTRLVLALAAERSAAGVPTAMVHLATVTDPQRVGQAVASALGLRLAGAVSPADVAEALAGADLLLVLDNCEHVAATCGALVSALIEESPGVRVIATSRSTLHVPDEYVVRLQPLPVPHDASAVGERQPSVRAFVEHARRRSHDFVLADADAEPIVEVLQRLDGLPLAIELVAGQMSVMSVAAVRDRLSRLLDLATSGRGPGDDERHLTLRLTVDSSYRLLSSDEQALLLALAPFPGGVDLLTVEGMAREVVPGRDAVDLLHRLVDISLIVLESTTQRYRILFTVREYLLDQLRREESLDVAELRFVEWARTTALELGVALMSAREVEADHRLRAEMDNLRAARDIAALRGDDEALLDLTLATVESMMWRDLRELWSWCLELADDPRHLDGARAPEVLGAAADASRLIGDFDRATALAGQALALGSVATPLRVVSARSALAGVALFRGDFLSAADCWELGAEPERSGSVGFLLSAALAVGYAGDGAASTSLRERARQIHARWPCPSHQAFRYYVEGELMGADDPLRAVPMLRDAIETAHASGASFIEGVARVALASAQTRIGDTVSAARTYAELLDHWHTSDRGPQLWTTARNAAHLLAQTGHADVASLLLIHAAASPASAAVDAGIDASRRTYLVLEDLPEPDIAAARTRALRLSPRETIELARDVLTSLAADGRE